MPLNKKADAAFDQLEMCDARVLDIDIDKSRFNDNETTIFTY
jgi:hypothetical protein